MADMHLRRPASSSARNLRKSVQGRPRLDARLINECGYHRRDEELNDVKRAILGE
jgi:hypothetical protein